MQVSLEEQNLLDLAGRDLIEDATLEERDQEIARNMVSRGLFNRLSRDGKLYYSLNGLEDIWRI